MAHRPSESGFSLVELILASSLAAMLAAGLAATFSTSSGLSHQSTTTLRVHEEHRRNLDAVANAMRGAVTTSLLGFDVNGNATEPSFQSVTGIEDDGSLTLDAARQITWRSNGETVPGVSQPGDLIVTQGGEQSVLARRVLANTFQVTRLGGTLRIQLTTYCLGPRRILELLAGQTSLTLRN